MTDFTADLDNLIRMAPSEAPHFGAPGRRGFHLIDATMMYAPKSGGVKRYLNEKRAWLARRRPDIRHTLVVPGRSTGLASPGVVTVAAARLPFGDGYRMPASLTKWTTVIEMLQPDIIEAGDVFVPGHGALEAGESLGVPVVGFCHTDPANLAKLQFGEWAEQPAQAFWASTFQRFDHVVAPSRYMAGKLAEAGITRITVQGLGVDTELFHPSRRDRDKLIRRLGLPADTRLLIFAGRPAKEKNIDSMVAAVERLGDPYHLVLVGAGKDVKVSPHVTCLDFERDPVKLAGLIASADAFLHANDHEIFGLAILEAMAAGTPVICASTGGPAELVDEDVGQKALTVDPAGLAEAIEALFARDLAALSAAARLRAETRHRWDNTFEGLTRLYSELIMTSEKPTMALSA